jgi:uncharacterized protein YcbK (DUF882 family)
VPISKLVRILPGRRASRALTGAAAAALLISLSAAPLQTLVANGDTRALTFAHIHTGETLNVTYKKRGQYDAAALKQINWFLRDWRRDEPTTMDPHLLDILWEVHRETGERGPITIISAYRSPQTNSMLRARGRGVARYSQHMLGKAIDFYIPNVELADMRAIGLRLQRGGVGFYPTSGSPFIHVDTGSVRHWPRMTRDQLARIFPDGKTVHLPADGKPMPAYAVAMAEIERNGGRAAPISLASLDDDDDAPAAPRAARTRIPTQTVLTNAEAPLALAAAPVTDTPPTVVASLAPTSMPVARSTVTAAVTPAALPMPSPRPRNLETTASISRNETRALGYAAVPERGVPAFGAVPSTHMRLSDLPDRGRAPQTIRATLDYAEASTAPALLYSMRGVEFTGELHEPDLYSLRGLVEPARATIRTHFSSHAIDAPSTTGFNGPALVPLQTLAFDRGAGIVTGAAATTTPPRSYALRH